MSILFDKKAEKIQVNIPWTRILTGKAEQFLSRKQINHFPIRFKKVQCKICNYKYSDERLTASLTLEWEKDWSIKSSGQTNRHIGSIESCTVAIRLLEMFLVIKYNLTEDEIASCFIRKIEFKTHSREHQSVHPLNLMATNRQIDWIDTNSAIGLFNIVVDNFQFEIEAEFCNRNKSNGLHHEGFLATALSDSSHYYNQGYKSTSIFVKNVVLNLENRMVMAMSKVKRPLQANRKGIGANKLRGLTFIDFLSIAGQLTQILLSSLDNITEEEQGNIWVRSLSTEFVDNNPWQVAMSMVHFTEFNKVKMNGETWRLATASFEIGSVRASAKVCHVLNK